MNRPEEPNERLPAPPRTEPDEARRHFTTLLNRLKTLDPQQARRLREQAEQTVRGHEAYARGRACLEHGRHDEAAAWLRFAARHHIAGAQDALDRLCLPPALPAPTAAPADGAGPATAQAGRPAATMTPNSSPMPMPHQPHSTTSARREPATPQATLRKDTGANTGAARHPNADTRADTTRQSGPERISPPPPTPALPPPHQATGVLLLTDSHQPLPRALPALDLLHPVQVIPHTGQAPGDLPAAYAILIDGRRNLPQVRNLCQTLYSADPDCPLVLVVTEGGLAAVTADWGIDAMLLDTAGPAEVEARLRLAAGHHQHTTLTRSPTVPLHHGVLSMDAATYTARRRGRALDLTMKEFELLKYLAQHPGRVFDRAQLLREIWGEDYAGGTRTLDVHVRRLRAKLGVEDAGLLVTVRGVGYRFAPTRHRRQQEHGQRPQAKPVPPATAAAAPAEASALLDSTACLTRGSG